MHKFRNTSNDTSAAPNEDLSSLQVQWGSYLSIASMIPNVTFLLLNAIIGHRYRSQPRLLAALIVVILLFIFSDVMTKVDTDSWQYEFLGVTLFSVVIINVMVAIFQVNIVAIWILLKISLFAILGRLVRIGWKVPTCLYGGGCARASIGRHFCRWNKRGHVGLWS